ncbi:hypothetical protein OPKNFCMD_0655 [Methylobacterium crusticola]|uniref:PAS domain-containing protein n=1 Tax=Methylobacterium crusticola TaxID=1697972 RepID=A0ABQ4QRX2_9HYPH|nr:hypothetical protein [Methylobacterium crusticola]GJD47942.1 hypothetical protein OPKNFCMD_0655 [Methylobacterium crusticola]
MPERDPPPWSNGTHVGIPGPDGARIVPVADLARRLGVDALIRLHPEDFAALSGIRRTLVHFNLEETLNAAGRRYALLPILRPGHRDGDRDRGGGAEVLPVLDPTRFRRGLCTAVIQRVPVRSVTADLLAHSLPTIRTREALAAALVRRYADLFPDLGAAEIVARGCAVTRLVLDES